MSTTDCSIPAAPGRKVILAGATGLVGGHILDRLLADDSVGAVHVLGRRAPVRAHPKLRAHVVDFAELPALPALPQADEVYLALGTTIRQAGSRAAFRAVDLDANLAVATAAFEAGARRIGLVSAMGADPGSRIFYNRVKGELEHALSRLAWSALVIARPSLLLGDRAALGQPARFGEGLGARFGAALRPLIPMNLRPIAAERVAQALLTLVPSAVGKHVLFSGAMQPGGAEAPP
ncbi:NAD(P)H-binding protein [Massilia sp.]|uniref:NAD(P)H-binding protein n=1 Tax=Massilia sp. TaxID=1882437 RepID=UPI00289F3E33|nr:NAD(P)H-binding protein [Massilia sp.]